MSDKKTLAIVGFASSSRDMTPWDNEDVTIWTLNKAHLQDWVKRFDAIFQLHTLEYLEKSIGLTPSDRQHWDWLHEEHDFPIYMQEEFEGFPSAVRFPIEELRDKFGDFFTGTPSFILAFALTQGFERIELYGLDMASNTEYEKQRDSMEYFIGWAEGMGIEIFIPDNCPLMKGRLYALEGAEIGLRQKYEFRVKALELQMQKQRAIYDTHKGYLMVLEELLPKYKKLDKLVIQAKEQLKKDNDLLQVQHGSCEEMKQAIRMFDDFFQNNGAGIISENASGGVNGQEAE